MRWERRFCIPIDEETLEKGIVMVRNRNTMTQVSLPPAEFCNLRTVILPIFGVVLFSVFSVVNGFTEIKKDT